MSHSREMANGRVRFFRASDLLLLWQLLGVARILVVIWSVIRFGSASSSISLAESFGIDIRLFLSDPIFNGKLRMYSGFIVLVVEAVFVVVPHDGTTSLDLEGKP